MREFKWKNNFINQDNKTVHINKYTLLLFIIKTICSDTTKLEQNIQSLVVQDFSVYEEYYIKNILPEADKMKNQSRFLHNQYLFNKLVENMRNNKEIKMKSKTKRKIFYTFSKYVNLKDLKSKEISYLCFCFCLFSLCLIFIFGYITSHTLWALKFILILGSLGASVFLIIFEGTTKSFTLNVWRINQELCMIELQKILEVLEKELKIPADPYKDWGFEEIYEHFKDIFDIPSDFLDRCKTKNIIDENYFVNSKYHHFLIQYLKKQRNEKYKKENFDWQLISHVLVFDIKLSHKSDFLKEEFKLHSPQGQKYLKFLKIFE